MNRAATITVVAVALVLIFVVAVLVRVEDDAPADERAMSRTEARRIESSGRDDGPRDLAPPAGDRSNRVQERLRRIRDDYAHSPEKRERAEGGSTPMAQAAPALTPKLGISDRPPGMNDEKIELDELEQTLLNDPDPDERITAVFFLSSSDDAAVPELLLKGLNDGDPEVRLAVVEALADYSDELQPSQLAAALADPDPEVRFEALSILGDMENPAAAAVVRSMLRDPDEDVRALAEGITETEN